MNLPPVSELGPFVSPLVFARVLAQAAQARRILPRLPEARGPRQGLFGSGTRIVKVAIVGESSAAGVGAAHQRHALSGGLARALSNALRCCVDWRVHARSGLTAERTLAEIVPSIPNEPVDAIVVVLGANDAMELTALAKWQHDLSRLIVALRARVGALAPVVIARAQPLECCPALPDELRRFLSFRCRRINSGTEALLARQRGVTLTVEPASLAPDEFASDGCHPNEKLYTRFGQHLAQVLSPLLEAPARGFATASRC